MSVKPRPVFHIEIPSADADRTANFYFEMFGWTHGEPGSDYLTFSTGNLSGAYPRIRAGLRAVTDQFRSGDTILYVSSDDLEQDLLRVRSLGGAVLLEPTRVSEAHRVALITDPNGARVMLASNMPTVEGA